METTKVTVRHCKRVHSVVLVVSKRGGGLCANLVAAHPTIRTRGQSWGLLKMAPSLHKLGRH